MLFLSLSIGLIKLKIIIFKFLSKGFEHFKRRLNIMKKLIDKKQKKGILITLGITLALVTIIGGGASLL